MNVLYVSAEVAPYLKTGGLGDVSEALPLALAQRDIPVSIVTPHYRKVAEYFRENAVPVIRSHTIRVMLAGTYHEAQIHESRHPSDERIPVYTVDAPEYYDRPGIYTDGMRDYPDNAARFVFFAKAVIELIRILDADDSAPDIVHCSDWHTGLVSFFIKQVYASMRPFDRIAYIYAIHNLAYQGVFAPLDYPLFGADRELLTAGGLEHNGMLNFMKAGIVNADAVVTVSPTYAREILTDEFGFGLGGVIRTHRKKLIGILNGARYETWSPEHDRHLPARYSIKDMSGKAESRKRLCEIFNVTCRDDIAVVGIVGRLTWQKGFDLLIPIIGRLLQRNIVLIVLGQGEMKYETSFTAWQRMKPGAIGVKIEFNEPLAHLVEAGSDMFLMPSLFEPCGLNQIYSMRYGNVPVVRKTGGLADTVSDAGDDPAGGTGFVFADYSSDALYAAIERALGAFADKKIWDRIVMNGMKTDFSWARASAHYIACYKKALRKNER
ncbi:MAG: glycogen synthase GlgA [Spirochaetes bacterium]|nr:glycogen synthase GlgA [Spirochaetota bacterium]